MLKIKILKIFNYIRAKSIIFPLIYFYRLFILFIANFFISYITIKIFNFKIKLFIKDKGISKSLYLFRERELEHKYILNCKINKKFDYIIYDIGSNIGYYTMIFSKLVSKNSKIIAIEPVKNNFFLLNENLQINGVKNVSTYNFGVSNNNEFKSIYLSKASNLNTFHNYGSILKQLDGLTEDVELKNIESINSLTNLTPNFIRMDVEGHEVEILSSILEFIVKESKYPKILFETHLSRYNENHNLKDIFKEFYDLGYIASMIGTSSDNGINFLQNKGYKMIQTIYSDGYKRGIFTDIDILTLDTMVHDKGGIRAILLEKYEL